jgi:hypothetical protein
MSKKNFVIHFEKFLSNSVGRMENVNYEMTNLGKTITHCALFGEMSL